MENRLQQFPRSLQLLNTCYHGFFRAEDERSLLQTVCQIMVEVGGYGLAWVGYGQPNDRQPLQSVAFAGLGAANLNHHSGFWASTEAEWHAALQVGQAWVIQNLQTELEKTPQPPLAIQSPYQAAIALPLANQDGTFGVLVLYTETPHAFNAEDVALLTTLAHNLSHRIGEYRTQQQQQLTQQALALQIEFDRLIAGISSHFLQCPSDIISREVNAALQKVGEFMQVDTSYICRFSATGLTLCMTHEWVASDVFSAFQTMQNLPIEAFPWALPILLRGEIVYVPKVDDLPPEAKIGRQPWQAVTARSMLAIPLNYHGTIIGCVGFASYDQEQTWSESNLQTLQVFADILTNLLQRQGVESALQASEERLRFALRAANQGLYDLNLQTGEAIVSPEYATMLGYDPTTFQETNAQWLARLHPDDFARVEATYRAYVQGEVPEYAVEFRQQTQSGEWKWILSLGKIVAWDEVGNPLRMLGTHTDITDRKQAEVERLQAEQVRTELTLLEQILDIILAGYWDWDLPNHQEYLSPGFKRMFGYEDHELPNSPESWQRLIFAEDLPGVMACFDRHVQSRGEVPFENEVRYRHKNGSTVWVICSGQVIEWDDAGNPIRMIGCHINITDLKRAEDILRTSEERLQLALEGSGDGLWDWNISTHEVYLSPRWLSILGYGTEELPGTVATWQRLIHPDDVDHVTTTLQAHLQDSSIPYAFEYRMQHRSGEWRWIANYGKVVARAVSGQPLRMVGIHRDITARKQAEAAIKESEARFRYLADYAPVLIWMSGQDRLCFHFNKSWLEFTGRTLEQEFGNGWAAGVHPDDLQFSLDTYINAFDAHQPFEMEYRLKRFDGEYRWLLDTGIPRFDAEGTFLGYIGSCMDISDRKQVEVQLQQANEELRRSNQELEQFAYIASHDLQEPLRAISGYTQLLSQEYAEVLTESTAQEYMNFIVDGTQRMRSLIQGLLAYSRAGSRALVLNRIDLHDVVKEACMNLQVTIAENQAMIQTDPLPTLSIDATQMVQVFQNLIGNAIKFRREEPPQIYIRAIYQPTTPARSPGALTHFLKTPCWLFSVQDNGIGIKSQYLERIFDIFRRLHSQRKFPGTGIGLALCKKSVERHGGIIWAESEIGVGTTFYFTLPLSTKLSETMRDIGLPG
jgi:PAS domain S-box-containing protein